MQIAADKISWLWRSKAKHSRIHENSGVKFNNHAGCADRMLAWCHKFSEKDLENIEVGLLKFFCTRKGKHGVNLMVAWHHFHHFIDIGLSHPGSASNCLAFSTSDFIKKLEKERFLVPGLHMCEDNAFANVPFLATLFEGVSNRPKDSRVFFNCNCASAQNALLGY